MNGVQNKEIRKRIFKNYNFQAMGNIQITVIKMYTIHGNVVTHAHAHTTNISTHKYTLKLCT